MKLCNFQVGLDKPLFLIAGPCVIEDEKKSMDIARDLKGLTEKLGIPFIFKASYDKANRTSVDAYRGPGLIRGLEILKRVREEFAIPVLSDVHRFEEIAPAAADFFRKISHSLSVSDIMDRISRRPHALSGGFYQSVGFFLVSHTIYDVYPVSYLRLYHGSLVVV